MTRLETLGKRVVDLRREQGLSREQLATRSGLSSRFLAEVESGRGNISLARLLNLCDALGIPAAVLAANLPSHPAGPKGTIASASAGRYTSILSMLNLCSADQLKEVHLWLSQRLDPSRRIVALIGLRGAGKTTIGRKVAARLRWPFIELDELIEKRAGLRLHHLFEVHGEEYYRRLEYEILLEFLSRTNQAVMAAGGGIVTREPTYDLLRQHCLIFWLKAKPEDHWNRVLEQDPRPMANYPDAFTQLQNLLRRRAPLYSQADFTIDTSGSGVARSVRQIVSRVKQTLSIADRGLRIADS